MPLLKYYQPGFYFLNWLFTYLTGLSVAKSALMLVLLGHLAATLATFTVSYKVSRNAYASALSASFLLSNTFLSLRSYGWEPITVVFLFLYPLGLYLFLKDPGNPFRFSTLLTLAVAYLSHPLIWFSLAMAMGIYLFVNAASSKAKSSNYLFEYLALVFSSVLVGAVQFIPHLTYSQVTSGVHMGVKYLPFYQVPFNVISLKAFFFDSANLKGPGPVVMIAFLLVAFFSFHAYKEGRRAGKRPEWKNPLLLGLTIMLATMVGLYYLELYNVFPMNVLRSIQYHRMIPEFIITAAILVAGLSRLADTHFKKAVYYALLTGFVLASFLIIFRVQEKWETTPTIKDRPEFVTEEFQGRMSMPYNDQSLSVRNSFTKQFQAYGYYEQGITNPYADEVFSVSSGYHDAYLTRLYLEAANVARLYVNKVEGVRDEVVRRRFNGSFKFNPTNNSRYGYFEIPLRNPSMAQLVSEESASRVQALMPGCRELFKEVYCGSEGEEFVKTDPEEVAYLEAYLSMLAEPVAGTIVFEMVNPDNYLVRVRNASSGTAVVVKMTHDPDFEATINGEAVPVSSIGPGFMLIIPGRGGGYDLTLSYKVSKPVLAGAFTTLASLAAFAYLFARRKKVSFTKDRFPKGGMG